MAYDFPSEEWVEKYKDVLNSSDAYKEAGAGWEAGPITLVVTAKPEVGLEEDRYIWMDLHKGECRDMKEVSKEEGEKAPFVITGEYARWKQVIQGQLDPIKGMMQGKLKLKGDLPTIVRHVKAAKELVNCTQQVDTKFLDQ